MSPRVLAICMALLLIAALLGWRNTLGTRYQPDAAANAAIARVAAAAPTSREIDPPDLAIGEPDGRIVFTSYRVGNSSGVFSMSVDGSDVTSLTYGGSAACQPDGTTLACVQFYIDTGQFEIVLIDREGTILQRLTESPEGDSTHPAWSPDGRRIAFQSGDFNNPSIYVMNADGSGRRRLTELKGNDRSPTWSPDGNWIAFSSHRDGSEGVFVMDSDGGQLRRLTDTETSCGDPAWSPDGLYIVGVVYDWSERTYSLRIMEAESGDWWNVLQDREQIVTPAWSPAGDWVVFGMTANEDTDIHVIDACGEGLQNLTNLNRTDTDPTWMGL